MVRIAVTFVVWKDKPHPFLPGQTTQAPERCRAYEYINPAHVVSVCPTTIDGRRGTEITITYGPRYTTIKTYEATSSVARRLTLTTPST
jgi:hypothetical protein